MFARLWLGGLLLTLSCVGPDAPDFEVCRDTIARICAEPRCSDVDAVLGADGECQLTLLQRTGCGSDDFGFRTPSRDSFLECRAPLVRESASRDAKPSCDDVHAMFSCGSTRRFFEGTQ